MAKMKAYIFFVWTFLYHQCYGGTWTEVKDEHVKLYDAYALNNDAYIDTIPRSNQNSPIDVEMSFHLYALAEFDAVSGSIELMGSLSMKWIDEIDTLYTAGFDPTVKDEIVVDYSKLWTPVIVHMNSAESIDRIGDENYKVRFNLNTGETTWAPRMILRSACTPDVTFFPFDEQTCVLTFAPWFSDDTMIRLLVTSSTWDTSQFAGSGVWKLKSTSAKAYQSGSYYYTDFTITIARQPVYFTVNIVLPVLLLSLLSGFVFLLPAASGERIGFTVTCFLSFVVLLQTMMKFLPEASAPMSLFCYYVIVMMLFTGFVCIVTTILLRIHHKAAEGEVWRWLVHVIEVITCVKCKRMKCKCRKNAVEGGSESVSCAGSSQIMEDGNLIGAKKGMPLRLTFDKKRLSTLKPTVLEGDGLEAKQAMSKTKGMDKEGHESDELEELKDKLSDITWEDVCRILDVFFFLAFIGVQCAFSIFFLVPLGSRA